MRNNKAVSISSFSKIPTGIEGLDEIMGGGFPKGRSILVCGSAGCGKTLMGVQFLVRGIIDYDEPAVLMTFEETVEDVTQNVSSLGMDINKLIEDKKLKVDYVRIERSEIEETGEYDLEGLFVRLNYAIDSIGAKRVVLDTIESIFGGIENETLLRSEIRRLFQWLKQKGVTAIITGERGEKSLTRQGLEEYVSDCVILLDFRVTDQIATRRLRIVKYRGSTHGTNEYPFLIDRDGITVLPITSLKLAYKASKELISTGLPFLDEQFDGGGIYKGNTVLITGSAGTAKTILASYFAMASCKRGERTLFFSFEESPDQLVRNMESIGVGFRPFVKSGLLKIIAARPSLHGLEMHLLALNKCIKEFDPQTVIIDPISSLVTVGTNSEVKAMLIRLLDMMKVNDINGLFTSLSSSSAEESDTTQETVSSLADTWFKLRNDALDNSVVRSLLIVKSRGVGHTGKFLDFRITNKGIRFQDEGKAQESARKEGKLVEVNARKSNTPAQKGKSKKQTVKS